MPFLALHRAEPPSGRRVGSLQAPLAGRPSPHPLCRNHRRFKPCCTGGTTHFNACHFWPFSPQSPLPGPRGPWRGISGAGQERGKRIRNVLITESTEKRRARWGEARRQAAALRTLAAALQSVAGARQSLAAARLSFAAASVHNACAELARWYPAAVCRGRREVGTNRATCS